MRRLLALADERGETRFGTVLTLHRCELELRAGELREPSRLLDEWAEYGAMEGDAIRTRSLPGTAGLAPGPAR